MHFFIKALISVLSLAASAFSAVAADFLYEHNGSRMRVNVQGKEVRIYYQEPRSGLRGVGVRPGSLLFNGKVSDGVLDGMSRIFNANCGEVDYFVSGTFRLGRDFKLNGAAPVPSDTSCRIVNNVYEGPNANLVFKALGGGTKNSGYTKVASGCLKGVQTSLNIRVGPGADFGKIGEFPQGSCGIQILTRCHDNWCVVQRGNTTGWASMRYIQR